MNSAASTTEPDRVDTGRRSTKALAAGRYLLGLGAMFSLLLAGCEGIAANFSSSSGGGSGGSGGGGPEQMIERPSVTLPSAHLKLLPFDVRLRRVADAVGVPLDDKVFDTAQKNRLALGAHDFANGTAPDLIWNSQRMATWMEAMLPVCRDTRVRSKLGDWKQGGVEKFVQAALGRASTADDLDALSSALAVTGDDGWVLTCVTLASSAEVLLQ
jgi:hypothetical protein